MSRPSPLANRFHRLCENNDDELRQSLQAIHFDYSTFAITSACPPSESSANYLDAFSPISPAPSHPPKTRDTLTPDIPVNELEHSEYPDLPSSVLNSLVQAALVTRTPIQTAYDTQVISTPPPQTQPNQQYVSNNIIHPNRSNYSNLRQSSHITPTVDKKTSLPTQPKISTSGFQTARSRLPSKLNTSRSNESNIHSQYRQPSTPTPSTSSFKPARSLLGAKRPRPPSQNPSQSNNPSKSADEDPDIPEVPNVDPKLVQQIMNETLDKSPGVDWDDIAGLHFAKQCVMEAVVWPMLRPDIFSGLRGPPKGLLLFGPPGTGKTLIGRAIASKSGARFFNISASSLVSKWAGEGEKTVRALFGVARIFQPSVVFIDEIDSLLTQRSDGEQEHSRRIKTEFLVQMDGAGTSREDRVLVVGATNRPGELDEAARRRLVKRLYIPLPDSDARCSLIGKLMQKQSHSLSKEDVASIAELSKGYSGSDMYALCGEAALGPVRDLGDSIRNVDVNSVRPVNMEDFRLATGMVRASVSTDDLHGYVKWNNSFGSFPMNEIGNDGKVTENKVK